MSKLARRSAISAAWLFARFGGRQFANAVAFFALAGLMSPMEFGIASIPVALVVILRTLLARGFRDVVIQRETVSDVVTDTAWWLNFGLGCLLAGLVALSAPLLAQVYGEARLVKLTIAASLVLVFTGAAAIQEARIEREFRHRLLTLSQVFASLAAAAAIWLATRGWGAWAVVAFNLIEALGLLIVTWVLARWTPGRQISLSEARRQIAFGWQLALSAVLTTGSLRFVQLGLGLMLGPQTVAHFRVASQINQLLTQVFAAPLVSVLLPAFSRASGDRSVSYLRALSAVAAISVPAFVGAAATAPTLLVLVLGETWRPAAEASGMLCFAIFPALALQVMNPMLIAIGRPNIAARMSLGSAIVAVAAALVGGVWGVTGAAIGVVARGLVTIPAGMETTRRLIGLGVAAQVRTLAAFAIPSFVMYLIVRAILLIAPVAAAAAWIVLAAAVVVGALCYVAMVRFGVSRLAPDAYEPLVVAAPKRLRPFLA